MKKIPLTHGKFALVNDEDYEWLNQWKWSYHQNPSGNKYARRREQINKQKRHIWMHREILKTPKELFTDHINGNGLDNRRSNIRICTLSQNQHNKRVIKRGSSKYKGVSWHTRANTWIARIREGDKLIHLGYYKDEIMAAKAYDKRARKSYGEFAFLNF